VQVSRALRKVAVLVLASLMLAGAKPAKPQARLAAALFATARWPYLPGSILPLRIDGITVPYHIAVLGIGQLVQNANAYAIPSTATGGSTLLIAGNSHALGATKVQIAPAPRVDRSLLFVASYDDGLVVHDPASFAVRGVLATGGVPSDVAVERSGRVAATDTQGSELTLLSLAPWNVEKADGVVAGDDVAFDPATGAVFVTDRDYRGSGALTRVGPDGEVTRVVTGETAEGIAIDQRRAIVYVANANDGTIAFVDAKTLRVLRRFPAVPRVFSLALSPGGDRLYAISNQSADSPFARPGAAIAISLTGGVPRVVARSADLAFPVGVALDAPSGTLFVSDEERREVDVLDAQTLRARHAPLQTCAIPWKLTVDEPSGRLYVPCAGDNEIDVFDTRTLHRIAHAPFATGGYPLAVAVWHP
jgi:DNA-binding beta-propeller fold protein YncE